MLSRVLLTFISLYFINLNCIAQSEGKTSWYYPDLEKVKGKLKYVLNYAYDLNATGCVSGDCKNGNGTFIEVTNSDYSDLKNPQPLVHFKIWKGRFYEDKYPRFEGKFYSRYVPYERTHDEKQVKLTPSVEWNLKDDDALAPYEVGSGKMTFRKWEGLMKYAIPANGSALKSFEAFHNFGIKYVNIEYNPGSLYQRVKGRMTSDGELVGGRLEFGDGGSYDGYLCNGKFFGPGRYIDKAGNKQEGIWMMDSLAIPVAVQLPKALFEPVVYNDTEGKIVKIDLGNNHNQEKLYDIADGWVSGDEALVTGKLIGGQFTGPGIEIDFNKQYGESVGKTYYAGLFENGLFKSGMRVDRRSSSPGSLDIGSGIINYPGIETNIITGNFNGKSFLGPCARKFYYDSTGKLKRMIEGNFAAGFKLGSLDIGERVDGWVYVNDFNQERDAAHLHYYSLGDDLENVRDEKELLAAYKKATSSSNFCFPSMKGQIALAIGPVKAKADIIIQRQESEALAKKESREYWERYWASAEGKAVTAKREAEKQKTAADCAAVNKLKPYGPGTLIKLPGKGVQCYAVVAGNYDCLRKTFPVYSQYWTSTVKDKGYMSVGKTELDPALLNAQTVTPGSFGICAECAGKGSIAAKEVVDVGGSSGYTNLGNGWAVKNPETYWVFNTMVVCAKCSGKGFR